MQFRSAAEVPDPFGLAEDGKGWRRLVVAFERVFEATILFVNHEMLVAGQVVRGSRLNFLLQAAE